MVTVTESFKTGRRQHQGSSQERGRFTCQLLELRWSAGKFSSEGGLRVVSEAAGSRLWKPSPVSPETNQPDGIPIILCNGEPQDSHITKIKTLRFVSEESKDKTVSDEDVLQTLLKTFRALFVNNLNRQTLLLNFLPEIKSKYPELQSDQCEIAKAMNDKQQRHILNPEEVLFNTLGFSITRRHSSLVSAGTGVFVSKGFVPKGTVVSMYPGTIYEKYEPILFQSIGNPFIFRCADGVLIDGNDKGISKAIYRSCSKRDQFGPLKTSDVFWLTSDTQNPLAVGQYVNNCSRDKAANVCYQEFDVPKCFPIEFMQYLPNTKYSHEVQRPLRCVVLVALQNIGPGEELFSNYYTIIC